MQKIFCKFGRAAVYICNHQVFTSTYRKDSWTLFANLGLIICLSYIGHTFLLSWYPPPLYKRWHREVRYVTLFLDHFFEKQENSLIIEEDQMIRRWHENRVTRNGADLIWLGRQVITGQYLDIVNTHHSLQSVWGWRMIFLSFIASLTSQRLNIAYKYPAEKYWNARKWVCTKLTKYRGRLDLYCSRQSQSLRT